MSGKRETLLAIRYSCPKVIIAMLRRFSTDVVIDESIGPVDSLQVYQIHRNVSKY